MSQGKLVGNGASQGKRPRLNKVVRPAAVSASPSAAAATASHSSAAEVMAKYEEISAELKKAAERQRDAARQQLACAFGDGDALASLASVEEVEQLEGLCLAGLGSMAQRRIFLREEEDKARQAARNTCVVCKKPA